MNPLHVNITFLIKSIFQIKKLKDFANLFNVRLIEDSCILIPAFFFFFFDIIDILVSGTT